MSKNISDIVVKTINGEEQKLSEFTGKVLLIVNVASYCGYTPQYAALESLNKKYQAVGLEVLGFPCNDFGGQEPGSNQEILQFCVSKYKVTFRLFDKVHAIGSQQHPLYARLTNAVEPKGDVSWNFEKFIISKQSEVVARFRSSVKPESPKLTAIIEREIAK
ncbi:MAG TPA: glutathione peroxidase [Nostocaceae cyanobacterium]|nr:glutathione peroxidase [Nostocaceae cyanobacterium]